MTRARRLTQAVDSKIANTRPEIKREGTQHWTKFIPKVPIPASEVLVAPPGWKPYRASDGRMVTNFRDSVAYMRETLAVRKLTPIVEGPTKNDIKQTQHTEEAKTMAATTLSPAQPQKAISPGLSHKLQGAPQRGNPEATKPAVVARPG